MEVSGLSGSPWLQQPEVSPSLSCRGITSGRDGAFQQGTEMFSCGRLVPRWTEVFITRN